MATFTVDFEGSVYTADARRVKMREWLAFRQEQRKIREMHEGYLEQLQALNDYAEANYEMFIENATEDGEPIDLLDLDYPVLNALTSDAQDFLLAKPMSRTALTKQAMAEQKNQED